MLIEFAVAFLAIVFQAFFQDDLRNILQNIHSVFPNVKIFFIAMVKKLYIYITLFF